LALETARALEEQGELKEAARWIRRAADEAEKDGNDERVLVFARAAADLMNAIESELEPAAASARSSLPTIPSLEWPSTIPPSAPRSTTPPPVSYVCELSTPVDELLDEHTIRVGAIRVAITGSIRDEQAFFVERLEPGQRSPPGTMEAILVLTGELEGSIELPTHLHVVRGATKKSY
jgi:hypothetical protein